MAWKYLGRRFSDKKHKCTYTYFWGDKETSQVAKTVTVLDKDRNSDYLYGSAKRIDKIPPAPPEDAEFKTLKDMTIPEYVKRNKIRR